MTYSPSPLLKRLDEVLQMHGVPDEKLAIRQGPRHRAKIDAIIRDVKASNAAADEDGE